MSHLMSMENQQMPRWSSRAVVGASAGAAATTAGVPGQPNLLPHHRLRASMKYVFKRSIVLVLILPAACLCPTAPGEQTTTTILSHDFKSDPTEAGWQLLQFEWNPSPAKGGWISGNGLAKCRTQAHENSGPKFHDSGCLGVEDGHWQGPPFGVTPHQYYRLTFQSHAQVPGYWAAMFFAADGQMLPADHNSGIFQTDDWIDNELYFQGKADAVSARLWFFPVSPKDGHAIGIRNVTLATATDQQVLDWADRLYATLPPVQYPPPRGRWTLIPRTMQKLQDGQPVRIVILGDSIGNDTGNSPLDKLIQRQYPGSRVTVITSVRGGTGCQY